MTHPGSSGASSSGYSFSDPGKTYLEYFPNADSWYCQDGDYQVSMSIGRSGGSSLKISPWNARSFSRGTASFTVDGLCDVCAVNVQWAVEGGPRNGWIEPRDGGRTGVYHPGPGLDKDNYVTIDATLDGGATVLKSYVSLKPYLVPDVRNGHGLDN